MGILSWFDWIGLGFFGEYCACLSEIQVGGRHRYITRDTYSARGINHGCLPMQNQPNRGYICAQTDPWLFWDQCTILWDPAMHCTWRRETVFDLLDLFGLFGLFVSGFFSDPNGRQRYRQRQRQRQRQTIGYLTMGFGAPGTGAIASKPTP
jgi:hypothetical protein